MVRFTLKLVEMFGENRTILLEKNGIGSAKWAGINRHIG